MIGGIIGIIKKEKIAVGGTVRIGIGDKNAPVRSLTPGKTVPSGPMQARVVETSADYSIIEVVCPCGCKTNIQCNYAAAKP